MKRNVVFCIGLLPVFAFCSHAAGAENAAPRETAYPVMGILETDPELQGKDFKIEGREAFEPIQERKLIYTGDGPALQTVRDAKIKYGFNVPVIVYMGGFTTNHGGATEIEKKYRGAVAMIDVASLAEAIDATATEFSIRVPADGEFAVKASTADISDPNDNKKYCFWIRVDKELMKVVEAGAKTGRLKVQRGFESEAAPHEAGATVLTPVNLGNREQLDAVRHSNSWPGGPDYLRYGLDPASEETARYKADVIIALMKTGYDGAWLDTFQPYIYNICDALGRRVTAEWDFAHGRRYTPETYLAALQGMIRAVRAKIKEATGRDPYLAANSVSGSYERGGKQMFAAPDRLGEPGRPGLLDAYCFEDSYIGPRGAVRTKGRKLSTGFEAVNASRWLKNVTNQRDAARSGLRALCMIGPAGYVAAYINPSLSNYDRLVRFAWCSFLLTVTKERTTVFGMPLLITTVNGKTGFLPLQEIFYYSIGDPVDDGDVESLKAPGTEACVRKFTNGLVVVNPPGAKKAATVAIPDGYADPKTKAGVKQVKLESGDGMLLLKGGK